MYVKLFYQICVNLLKECKFHNCEIFRMCIGKFLVLQKLETIKQKCINLQLFNFINNSVWVSNLVSNTKGKTLRRAGY
jgi:hypothetical protein